jgi:hypothetical protein
MLELHIWTCNKPDNPIISCLVFVYCYCCYHYYSLLALPLINSKIIFLRQRTNCPVYLLKKYHYLVYYSIYKNENDKNLCIYDECGLWTDQAALTHLILQQYIPHASIGRCYIMRVRARCNRGFLQHSI